MASIPLARRMGIAVGATLLITAFAVGQCQSNEEMLAKPDTECEADDIIARRVSNYSQPFLVFSTTTMMASRQTKLRETGQRAADALLVTGAATELLKNLFNLPRPDSDDPNLVKLGLAPPSDGHGFPSGHASAAFAFATVMADADRDNQWFWYGLAAGVGWSRLELHAHHVWDIVAGAGLGTYVAQRSLDSNSGLLGVVGLEPKTIKVGGGTLTLGPKLVPGGVGLATIEF